jgi:hypothetical protein
MQIYRFTIHNLDGSEREETGRMALPDDNAARAFGKSIIRDIMTGDALRYANWTMDISRGVRREVCRLSFSGGSARAAAAPPVASSSPT